MTIEWLAGNRLSGTTAELPVSGLAAGSVGGWVEVGRTTLGSAGDTIDVSSLADKRYYMVLVDGISSGSIDFQQRFGSGGTVDTGSNYSRRQSVNGAADGTSVNRSNIDSSIDGSVNQFMVSYIANLSGKEKLVQDQIVEGGASGSGTAPERSETVGKWVNTSNPIDVMRLYNTQAGSYNTNSEVVVLGWDDSDSHTTNFWEELASVTTTGAGTSVSSGTFTAKKYLWVQVYAPPGASQVVDNFWWRFNGDSGSNYARRYSSQGGSDGTATSDSRIQVSRSGVQGDFTNAFIVNNSANEKLMMYNTVPITALGAGTAPNRQEGVGKWTNTASQITSIVVSANADSFPAGWIMKVWGSN